jgi:hypothetical protein
MERRDLAAVVFFIAGLLWLTALAISLPRLAAGRAATPSPAT